MFNQEFAAKNNSPESFADIPRDVQDFFDNFTDEIISLAFFHVFNYNFNTILNSLFKTVSANFK